VDSCGKEAYTKGYKIDLKSGEAELFDSDLVEVLQEDQSDTLNVFKKKMTDKKRDAKCSKNVLLRIPFLKLTKGTIVKLELVYDDIGKGTTFHIGNSPTNNLYGIKKRKNIKLI
jgi:hypothetical protein